MARIKVADAKPCVCGSHPIWSKSRGRTILACPSVSCGLYLAVSGPNVSETVENWNKAVTNYADTLRKRH